MNLFVTYTPEEIKFLKSLMIKDVKDLNNLLLFKDLKKEDFSYLEEKKLAKKEIINKFDFIYVKKGRIGVVKNSKIVKILRKDNCFGFLKVFNNEEFVLISIEESEVLLFNVETKKGIEKILNCVAKEIKNKVLI